MLKPSFIRMPAGGGIRSCIAKLSAWLSFQTHETPNVLMREFFVNEQY
jgi:hypothetical protein